MKDIMAEISNTSLRDLTNNSSSSKKEISNTNRKVIEDNAKHPLGGGESLDFKVALTPHIEDIAVVAKKWRDVTLKHAVAGTLQGATSAKTVHKEFNSVLADIKAQRPELAGAKWDFSLKDGKFMVQGNALTANDKDFLQELLNGNKKLLSGAQDFVGAAVLVLQSDDDGWVAASAHKGVTANPEYFNVAAQLGDSFKLREHLVDKMPASMIAGQGEAPLYFVSTMRDLLISGKVDTYA